MSLKKIKMKRRDFLKKSLIVGGIILLNNSIFFKKDAFSKKISSAKITKDPSINLYRSINGMPNENLTKIIELMGGIDNIIGEDDVVIIKPNVQWWNHGASNLSSIKDFVDLIMNHPYGFNGEVIIIENCHRGPEPWSSQYSGWAHQFNWNSDIININNMNDLTNFLKNKYTDQFTTFHLLDVDAGGKRVFSPKNGPGYVYCDGSGGVPLIELNNDASGNNYRSVIMTYPIIKTDKGTMVDFKNGVWKKNSYTKQPVKFINFAALNHHSIYGGVTSAVKNYLGISDLSGGPNPIKAGHLTEKYYNFHSFPFNEWDDGPVPGMLGTEIGVFMNTIRKADLNIITAEWVGLASRTEPPISHTRAILACKDPVALDYHASKYLLYPNSKISMHNPDNKKGPFRQYLLKCAEKTNDFFDEEKVQVISYNFNTGKLQNDNDLMVIGNKKWGNNVKIISKYLTLRYL